MVGPSVPDASTHWPAVAAALGAGVLAGAAVGKMAPALPTIQAELALDLVGSGWLVATFNTIALVAGASIGLLADRAGAYRFCIAGCVLLAAGCLAGAAAATATTLFASRILEGVGWVAVIVSAPALIASVTAPAQRGIAFGLWSSYMPTGGALAIAFTPLTLAIGGWRAMWITLAAAAGLVIAALIVERRIYRVPSSDAPRTLASVKASLALPVPWLLGLTFSMYALQFFAIMMWLPTYLQDTRGIVGTPAALLTALMVGANVIGNLVGGWLVQQNIPRGTIIASVFVNTAIVFIAIFALGLPDPVRYALVIVYSIICGPVPAAALSGGARCARSPAEVGVIQGLILQLTNVGLFFGPPLTAAIVNASGTWDSVLWVLLGASAIGFVVALRVRSIEVKQTPETSHRRA